MEEGYCPSGHEALNWRAALRRCRCGRIVGTIVRDQSDWNSMDGKDLYQLLN